MSVTKDVSGAITRGLMGYFDFKGKASRRDFWIWLGFAFVVSNVAEALYWLLVVPTIAYSARRMHDVGKSAWWLLVWPVALFFSLRPSITGHVSATPSTAGSDWISERATDAQSLVKTVVSKFVAIRGVLTGSTTSSATPSSSGSSAIPTSPSVSGEAPRPASRKPVEPVKTAEPPRVEKPSGPTDVEVFSKMAAELGIVTTSEESVVAVVQSLIRRVWTQVRTQPEVDPVHTEQLRLALRALADYAKGKHSHVASDSAEQAKAYMWYGILLAMVTTDDRSPTTLGTHGRMSSGEALREARRIFESNSDKKMAGRCMEELGQYGRLLGRNDLITEGFNGAVELFQSAGAADRAKQALTNAGSNFQRHSSAFFDGGQPSLKATTILGSVQGERLRDALHHID